MRPGTGPEAGAERERGMGGKMQNRLHEREAPGPGFRQKNVKCCELFNKFVAIYFRMCYILHL